MHRTGERDERVDERGAERVKPPERAEIASLGQEHIGLTAFVDRALNDPERVVELLTGLFRAWPQEPLLGDGGQVAVFERDRVEAAFRVAQDVDRAERLGA